MNGENFFDWSRAEPEEVARGVNVLVKQGRSFEVGKITLAPGTELEEHAHSEEQFFYMLEGTLRYRVGTEEQLVGPGEAIFMPGGVPHGGRVEGDQCVVFIEVKALNAARI